MTFLVVGAVALAASTLTFFTGFGLGTLLLPALALFFPVPVAVTMTACVHLLNGLFKLVLVGRLASGRVIWRFGVPAALAAFLGARLLLSLAAGQPLLAYTLGERLLTVTPVKLLLAALMIAFALLELSGRLERARLPESLLPVGGALSGFFGGLSGHQGALRSMFLVHAGLDQAAFVGTGAAISALIDLSRLGVYLAPGALAGLRGDLPLLATATVAAFLGAYAGSRFLGKVTLRGLQRAVAASIVVIAVGLGSGIL